MGRFINSDTHAVVTASMTALTDKNLFAYCDSNPVVRIDTDGKCWHIIVGAVVGVATQYVVDVAVNLASGKSFVESLKPTSTLADYGSAALGGALAATGIGMGASIVANAALGGATYLVNCSIKGEEANATDLVLSAGVGAIAGVVGGSGADGAKLIGIAQTSKKILATTVSPKKIAMYSAKVTACRNIAFTSCLRTIVAGTASNGLNMYRREVIGSAL